MLAKIATSLEEHSFVRCLKLITELMLRSKDLSLFYVAGDFLRHSAMYPGQKFKVNFLYFFYRSLQLLMIAGIEYPFRKFHNSVF